VHGGPNPVSGATVTLYATKTTASPSSANNYGYGVAGQSLGTATTNSSGVFSFSSPTACPAGQQAYIVSAGGKTGTNATNSAAVLMAALGPCSSLVEGSGTGHTTVIINEPTTIAAAYALSQFMTTTGNGASTVVNISAPANNNAATPACTTSGTSPNIITTGCAASGLAHAFLNAANLVNTTTGITKGSVASGSTVTVTVPQALINTLANSVEACVNSSGSLVTGACATLMTNTTPTAEVFGATAPTNTLQALLDLAQYPSMATNSSTPPGPPTGSTAGNAIPSAATTALFNLGNSNGAYGPSLTAAPDDFTIAINYVFAPTGTTANGAGTTAAFNVWGLGTDNQDNIYAYVRSTPTYLYSLTSNGAQNWATASTTTCGYSTTGSRCVATTDTLGNVWLVDGAGLTKFNAATGVQGTTYTTGDSLDMALVDVGNNVWLAAFGTGTQTGASALEELPQGASTIVETQVGTGPLTSTTSLHDLAFDSAGNLWSASDAAAGVGLGAITMISGNNSLTAPNFTYTTTSNPALYEPLGTGSHSWSPIIDGSGNAWFFSEDELNEVASTGTDTGGAVNYNTSGTLVYGPIWDAGVVRNAVEDGDGKFIVTAASTGAGYISVYYPNAPSDGQAGAGEGGADVYLNPCYVAPAATTCASLSGGQSTTVNVPRGVAIDASGAIWSGFTQGSTTATGAAGDLIQVLGPGAPVWSQVSWIPMALAPNLSGNTTSLRPF
jgi:hypothetical protein